MTSTSWGYTPPSRTRTYSGVHIVDLLEAGILDSGDTLWSPDRQTTAVVTESGALLIDDRTFRSPSGAAAYANPAGATNGWHYWSLSDGQSLFDLRASLLAKSFIEDPGN